MTACCSASSRATASMRFQLASTTQRSFGAAHCRALRSKATSSARGSSLQPARARRTPVQTFAAVESDPMDDALACDLDPRGFKPRTGMGSLFDLAKANFRTEASELGFSAKSAAQGLLPNSTRLNTLPDCFGFQLDDDAVARRGDRYEREEGEPPAIRAVYEASVAALDFLYAGKPIQKFWVLEVIARIPYFSYVSVLNLYESLGWWQNSELSKLHFAEGYAEQHHLLIMESLGGNRRWPDRFVAQHAAVAYYWGTCFLYMWSPKWSYYFMQLVEQHASDTYAVFVEQNAALLREYPAPVVAQEWYRDGDMYLFDEFQSTTEPGTRRPPVSNLLEVFENVRDDELEHVKTMVKCQDYEWLGTKQVSPHFKVEEAKRELWTEWAKEINSAQDLNNKQAAEETGAGGK